jgi:uncharacterized protein DUF1552
MVITKKCLPRRTFLRGMSTVLALPLLDAMTPAFAAIGSTAAKPIRRLGAVYLPNGTNMAEWTPAAEGAAFEMSRILQPLTPFRDQLLVLSGMSNRQADPWGDGGGDHSRGQTAFLTGVHAKKSLGDVQAGVSMDQIAAKQLGQYTQLASLELGLESNDLVGECDNGMSCGYSSTIAWSGPTTPLGVEADPRAVFERMFGVNDSTDPRTRHARIKAQRSILDMVNGELARLKRELGVSDTTKLNEYTEAVRDIERRIQRAEEQSDQEFPVIDQPAGVPAVFEEYATLMFDMLAMAYQTDLTRIATFLMGREKSLRTYSEIGIPDPHHPISHHAGVPAQLEKVSKISTFHAQLFAKFLEKLRSTPDGDGSLLDHSMIIYGAGLSNGNQHTHNDLPIVLVGGGAGQIKGGRHIKFPMDTPLTNLHLTVLDKMGIPAETLGDSTGKVNLLSGV